MKPESGVPGSSSENLRRIASEIGSALALDDPARRREEVTARAKKLFEFTGLVTDGRTLQDAARAARRLPDDINPCLFLKSRTFARCARGLVAAAELEGNPSFISAAARLVREIPIESDRRGAAAVCAGALLSGSLIEDGLDMAMDAVEIAKVVAGDAEHGPLVYRIATALADTAGRKKLLTLAEQAGELIGLVSVRHEGTKRDSALASCARAFAVTGVHRAEPDLIAAGVGRARSIEDPAERSGALLDCAEALFLTGAAKEGAALFLESVRSAEDAAGIKFDARRYARHVRLIERFIPGLGACAALATALEGSNGVKSSYLRCRIMLCRAETLEAEGRGEDAVGVLEGAIPTIRDIGHDYDKAVTLRKLAELLPGVGLRQKMPALISSVQKLGRGLKHDYLKNQVLDACEAVLSNVVANNRRRKLPSLIFLI